MTDLSVIDVSHHQTVTDWTAVKNAGVLGVIHKATEGETYFDPTYQSHRKGAEAAGLKWAAYHFLRPGDMGAQMEFFLDCADLPEGARICLDHEDSGVSLADLQECVEWLFDCAEDLQVAIYSGHLIKDQLGDNSNPVLAKTSLWLAQYTTGTPSWPKGTWPAWTLWQFTDKASVAGITGAVDGNRFNGSDENCLKWFGPVPQPVPPPVPEDQQVLIDINVPPGVHVQLTINGELVPV
jgi:lysozyme